MMQINSTECLQQKHAGVSLAQRAVAEGMSSGRYRVKRTKSKDAVCFSGQPSCVLRSVRQPAFTSVATAAGRSSKFVVGGIAAGLLQPDLL